MPCMTPINIKPPDITLVIQLSLCYQNGFSVFGEYALPDISFVRYAVVTPTTLALLWQEHLNSSFQWRQNEVIHIL